MRIRWTGLDRAKSAPVFDGRTVVGVVLVAIALAGGLVLARASRATVPVLAAARDLRPNAPVSPTDFDVVEVRAPERQADLLIRSDLVGTITDVVAARTIRQGELLRKSDFSTRPTPMREVSFAVASDSSLQGRLAAGDRVDVVATLAKGSPDSRSIVVARNSEVVVAPEGSEATGGLTSSSGGVVTLSVESREAMSIAFASHNGEVNLIRTTGTDHPLPAEVDGESIGAAR